MVSGATYHALDIGKKNKVQQFDFIFLILVLTLNNT